MQSLVVTTLPCLVFSAGAVVLMRHLKASRFRPLPALASAFVSGMGLLWLVTVYSKLLGAGAHSLLGPPASYFSVVLAAALLALLLVAEVLSWATRPVPGGRN